MSCHYILFCVMPLIYFNQSITINLSHHYLWHVSICERLATNNIALTNQKHCENLGSKRHWYGISTLSQKSLSGQTGGGIVKCCLYSQAIKLVFSTCMFFFISENAHIQSEQENCCQTSHSTWVFWGVSRW